MHLAVSSEAHGLFKGALDEAEEVSLLSSIQAPRPLNRNHALVGVKCEVTEAQC